MSHPLDGASLRLARADRHLTEADDLVSAFGLDCQNHILADENGKILRLNGWPQLPIILPLVISDVVHNLRAALDYIVYEVAREDSGKVQENTQFIIEDVKVDTSDPRRGFDVRSKKHLKGLKQCHIDAIEHCQPYKGVEWTKALRDISNPDKHRNLTVLSSTGRPVQLMLEHNPKGRFGTNRLRVVNGGVIVDRYDVHVDAHDAIAIALADPSKPGIMRALRDIQAAVAETI